MTFPIVVGCDGTPDSDNALRLAAEEARLRHAPLRIVCAYERPVDPELNDFDVPDEQLRARTLERGEQAVRRAFGGHAPADYAVLALAGEPSEVLREQAKGAVMIVIGGHQRPLLQRVFRRGTSGHLLHHGGVPVLVVPSADH